MKNGNILIDYTSKKKYKKIIMKYKYFPNPDEVNSVYYTYYMLMREVNQITSDTLENYLPYFATQENAVIKRDLINKMSDESRDILRVMFNTPKEFFDELANICFFDNRIRIGKVYSAGERTLKTRFRIWVCRRLKKKYKNGTGDADIMAGKIMREIKSLL